MPYQGNRRKKKRTHSEIVSEEEKAAPRSMIFRRGKVGANIVSLISDFRQVMEPFTARRLQESKRNKLKDFISVSSSFGVTHFLIFSPGQNWTNLRILRVPRGPTLTFRVKKYSLTREVKNMQRRPYSILSEFQKPPLVILNNFSNSSDHLKIVAAMLQNMFPAINVGKIRLATQRRVVLFSYNAEQDCVHFRHYLITASPVGLTRTVKKVIKAKIPNLEKYDDISDYVLKGDNALSSDSEIEDTEENRVHLPQDFCGRGNVATQKSAVRLKELGPRLELELLKIEEGINDGMALYNKYIKKTDEEVRELGKRKEEKAKLKAERRRVQEENVQRKKQEKEEKRKKKEEKRKALLQNIERTTDLVESDEDEDEDEVHEG